MKKTIEELVILSRSGNNKAKEELVKMTIDDAYVVARSLCHSEADAQDVLQDCYMQAFQKLEMLNNPSSFRSWIKTMVRNRCFDLYKTQMNSICICFYRKVYECMHLLSLFCNIEIILFSDV